MKIKTKYFDEIEVEGNEVICFPHGIFGFEDEKEFIMIRFDNEGDSGDGGILCLQSTKDEELAFVVLNPFYVNTAYAPELSEDDLKELQIGDQTPVSFYAITVVKQKFEDSTVNLRCPIVINTENNTAKQVFLDADIYSLRHPIGLPKKGE